MTPDARCHGPSLSAQGKDGLRECAHRADGRCRRYRVGVLKRVVLDPRVAAKALDQAIARLSGVDHPCRGYRPTSRRSRRRDWSTRRGRRSRRQQQPGRSDSRAGSAQGRSRRAATESAGSAHVRSEDHSARSHRQTGGLAITLRRQREPARKLLDLVLYGRLTLTPKSDKAGRTMSFAGRGSLLPVLAPALPLRGTSPGRI